MSKIKRSVSLYSLQDEYCRGRMKLDDIFKWLDATEVEGFEFISDQMMHKAPFPDDSTLKEWDRMMNTYKVKPVCNDIFINSTLYKNRVLTRKENLQLLINEIELADRLGFRMLRLVSLTPVNIIEDALVHCEKYGITMGLEVHGGMSFDNPLTKEFIDLMFEVESEYLGLIPDMGIFNRRHPRMPKGYFRHMGTSDEIIAFVDTLFENGMDPLQHYGSTELPNDMKKLAKSEADIQYGLFSFGYENSSLEILKPYMPYVKHIHGKIYEMTDDGTEYSIPYDEIVKFLKDNDYDGYISTEYEGSRFVIPGEPTNELEQVKRHQELLKRLISE
ncbi:MAG: TIM barrel protein [Eubacteriales bacterium]